MNFSYLSRFFYVGFFIFSANALAAVDFSVCPDVTKLKSDVTDPGVRLDDVMYQFQDHFNATDGLIREGRDGKTPDLSAASDHMRSAQNCALLVVRYGQTTLRPTRAAKLPADQQRAYLSAFTTAMGKFADLLGAQVAELEKLSAFPPAARDYTRAHDNMLDIDEFATEAHNRF